MKIFNKQIKPAEVKAWKALYDRLTTKPAKVAGWELDLSGGSEAVTWVNKDDPRTVYATPFWQDEPEIAFEVSQDGDILKDYEIEMNISDDLGKNLNTYLKLMEKEFKKLNASRPDPVQAKYQPLIDKTKKALSKAGVNYNRLRLKYDGYDLTLCVGRDNPDFEEGAKGEVAIQRLLSEGLDIAADVSGSNVKRLSWD